MNLSKSPCTIVALLLALAADRARSEPCTLHLTLQTRNPSSNRIVTKTENVRSDKVAVVIVDPWNYHWCMTACERVSAMAPRWNRAVECARGLGMPVLWAPSDVAGNYAGYPQRERALAVRLIPVPKERAMPPARFTAPGGGCMCGPGINCAINYGENAINPELNVADNDLIVSSTGEVYSLLRERGITHVIYMGLHTNMCLFAKPGALKYMVQAGLNCMLARDINDAITSYNPQTGFTPDKGTQQTDADLERAGVPTINVVEEWRKAGVWNDEWIVETVRITPWGKRPRPYLFEKSTIVTLTTPWLEKVEIRYTLDGSEPGPHSPLYEKPINLTDTADLHTAAFRDGVRVSLPTSAYFARLPARPPKPDVYLDALKDVIDPYAQSSPDLVQFIWAPKVGRAYDGQPLRIRGKTYPKGLGFYPRTGVRYELKPEYDRFVALAGVADNMVDFGTGRHGVFLAPLCSAVFRVFIDGRMMAESPVMRISQEPWRFDVRIPAGSRYLRVVCMDAGGQSTINLGNLVEAGFTLKKVATK
jgi:nicotinamidase-related amidase